MNLLPNFLNSRLFCLKIADAAQIEFIVNLVEFIVILIIMLVISSLTLKVLCIYVFIL